MSLTEIGSSTPKQLHVAGHRQHHIKHMRERGTQGLTSEWITWYMGICESHLVISSQGRIVSMEAKNA